MFIAKELLLAIIKSMSKGDDANLKKQRRMTPQTSLIYSLRYELLAELYRCGDSEISIIGFDYAFHLIDATRYHNYQIRRVLLDFFAPALNEERTKERLIKIYRALSVYNLGEHLDKEQLAIAFAETSVRSDELLLMLRIPELAELGEPSAQEKRVSELLDFCQLVSEQKIEYIHATFLQFVGWGRMSNRPGLGHRALERIHQAYLDSQDKSQVDFIPRIVIEEMSDGNRRFSDKLDNVLSSEFFRERTNPSSFDKHFIQAENEEDLESDENHYTRSLAWLLSYLDKHDYVGSSSKEVMFLIELSKSQESNIVFELSTLHQCMRLINQYSYWTVFEVISELRLITMMRHDFSLYKSIKPVSSAILNKLLLLLNPAKYMQRLNIQIRFIKDFCFEALCADDSDETLTGLAKTFQLCIDHNVDVKNLEILRALKPIFKTDFLPTVFALTEQISRNERISDYPVTIKLLGYIALNTKLKLDNDLIEQLKQIYKKNDPAELYYNLSNSSHDDAAMILELYTANGWRVRYTGDNDIFNRSLDLYKVIRIWQTQEDAKSILKVVHNIIENQRMAYGNPSGWNAFIHFFSQVSNHIVSNENEAKKCFEAISRHIMSPAYLDLWSYTIRRFIEEHFREIEADEFCRLLNNMHKNPLHYESEYIVIMPDNILRCHPEVLSLLKNKNPSSSALHHLYDNRKSIEIKDKRSPEYMWVVSTLVFFSYHSIELTPDIIRYIGKLNDIILENIYSWVLKSLYETDHKKIRKTIEAFIDTPESELRAAVRELTDSNRPAYHTPENICISDICKLFNEETNIHRQILYYLERIDAQKNAHGLQEFIAQIAYLLFCQHSDRKLLYLLIKLVDITSNLLDFINILVVQVERKWDLALLESVIDLIDEEHGISKSNSNDEPNNWLMIITRYLRTVTLSDANKEIKNFIKLRYQYKEIINLIYQIAEDDQELNHCFSAINSLAKNDIPNTTYETEVFHKVKDYLLNKRNNIEAIEVFEAITGLSENILIHRNDPSKDKYIYKHQLSFRDKTLFIAVNHFYWKGCCAIALAPPRWPAPHSDAYNIELYKHLVLRRLLREKSYEGFEEKSEDEMKLILDYIKRVNPLAKANPDEKDLDKIIRTLEAMRTSTNFEDFVEIYRAAIKSKRHPFDPSISIDIARVSDCISELAPRSRRRIQELYDLIRLRYKDQNALNFVNILCYWYISHYQENKLEQSLLLLNELTEKHIESLGRISLHLTLTMACEQYHELLNVVKLANNCEHKYIIPTRISEHTVSNDLETFECDIYRAIEIYFQQTKLKNPGRFLPYFISLLDNWEHALQLDHKHRFFVGKRISLDDFLLTAEDVQLKPPKDLGYFAQECDRLMSFTDISSRDILRYFIEISDIERFKGVIDYLLSNNMAFKISELIKFQYRSVYFTFFLTAINSRDDAKISYLLSTMGNEYIRSLADFIYHDEIFFALLEDYIDYSWHIPDLYIDNIRRFLGIFSTQKMSSEDFAIFRSLLPIFRQLDPLLLTSYIENYQQLPFATKRWTVICPDLFHANLMNKIKKLISLTDLASEIVRKIYMALHSLSSDIHVEAHRLSYLHSSLDYAIDMMAGDEDSAKARYLSDLGTITIPNDFKSYWISNVLLSTECSLKFVMDFCQGFQDESLDIARAMFRFPIERITTETIANKKREILADWLNGLICNHADDFYFKLLHGALLAGHVHEVSTDIMYDPEQAFELLNEIPQHHRAYHEARDIIDHIVISGYVDIEDEKEREAALQPIMQKALTFNLHVDSKHRFEFSKPEKSANADNSITRAEYNPRQ